jgi:hypothetical protein
MLKRSGSCSQKIWSPNFYIKSGWRWKSSTSLYLIGLSRNSSRCERSSWAKSSNALGSSRIKDLTCSMLVAPGVAMNSRWFFKHLPKRTGTLEKSLSKNAMLTARKDILYGFSMTCIFSFLSPASLASYRT